MVTGILKIHVGWEAFEGPCGRRSSKVTWATSNNHERVDVFHGCLLSIEP